MPWKSISIGGDSTLDFLATFPASLGMELPDYAVEVGDVRVDLRNARLYNPRMDLADRADVERRLKTGTLSQATLVPLRDSEFLLQLVRSAAPSDEGATGLRQPAFVAHADWGIAPNKRWVAVGILQPDGRYVLHEPRRVAPDAGSLREIMGLPASGGSAIFGFDFPIGVPRAYAGRAGITSFRGTLSELGSGMWARFFDVAVRRDDIGLHRPFYPFCPGGTKRDHLVEALGLTWPEMFRECELRTQSRPAACALFWTLGGNQVGKGALSGWREVIQPAVRELRDDLAIWPFDGTLAECLERAPNVIAETYPAEFYRHLNLHFASVLGGKRQQAARRAHAGAVERWAEQHGILITDALRTAIREAFGDASDGEDRFDAVVGLCGMVNVLIGAHTPGDPPAGPCRTIEGWILGQAP